MEIKSYRDYGTIDPSIISEFALKFGVNFPKSYIELLSKHNAIRPLLENFDYQEDNGDVSVLDVSFYGYGYEEIVVYDESDLYKFQNSMQPSNAIEINQPDEYSYNGVVVIGESVGGDYIAFDCRYNIATDNPPVVVMYHDDYIEDGNGNAKMRIIKVAENFDDFLNLLHE